MFKLDMLVRAITRLPVLLLAYPVIASAQVATPPMVGRWRGTADIVVNWTKQRTLLVDVTIYANDKVTGTVGDAVLVDGRLATNRGRLSRLMNWKTDYVIDGRLDGPIIRAENIERTSVRMPLNWVKGRFEGGVNSSGAKVGGAEKMVLAAKGLVLSRMPDMIICQLTSTTCGP